MRHSDVGRDLWELASAAGDVLLERKGEGAIVITGIAYDSRAVEPGYLFFCVPGTQTDGHRFAHQAVEAGAAALCVERPIDLDVPQLVVSDARRAMARIAAEFYARPADDILLIGVTGTNGKTTTTFLIESILAAAGHTTGVIGTIETHIAGDVEPGVRTTPESIDLQKLFTRMRSSGVSAVAMEVTSHGLALHRVEGVRFASAAFTNLSQDHLDFHSDMADYFEAKRSLFRPDRVKIGAANIDDPYGRKLIETANVPWLSFGTASEADVCAQRVNSYAHGSDLLIVAPDVEIEVSTSLVGSFNVSNCLAAAAAALGAGVEPKAIEVGISSLRAVPGRFEGVDAGQPFTVVVDYAHTPDSLDNVLRAARDLARVRGGRVLCTFGCGGDRDRAKRPLMGAVAARLADFVVVTSDNPRSERPEDIIAEILEGVLAERADGPDATLVDRSEAISHLLRSARAGDVAVIAGKGHEPGQQFSDRTIPFDDREVARAALADLGWEDPA
jgi:UDP-N-acetylmuramoyl-L-alanyl-D-glutamate--2,6-diaminopimelate ligase